MARLPASRRMKLAISDIVEAIGDEIPTQLGGGIRDLETIERYLDDGITYIIIGTAAVKTPGFLHDACNAFPGHIMVGLDAKDGKVAVNGWSKVTGHDVVDLAKKFEDYGVEAIIYTDIGRDGMLSGSISKRRWSWPEHLPFRSSRSGGISNLDDVKALCEIELEGIAGAITGRAIYEGTLDFKLAQALADDLSMKMRVQDAAYPIFAPKPT